MEYLDTYSLFIAVAIPLKFPLYLLWATVIYTDCILSLVVVHVKGREASVLYSYSVQE